MLNKIYKCKQDKNQCGFTLIELIVFIVLVAILLTGLVASTFQVLGDTFKTENLGKAQDFAIQRMELILGQKRQQGYTVFTDPCNPGPGPAICSVPAAAGFTVIRTSPATLPPLAGSGETTIVITVTGPNGSGATLTTLVSEY